MTIDEQGFLWLSDPWVAGIAFLAVLGVLLWSHGWIVAGRPPHPRAMAVKVRRPRRARAAGHEAPVPLRRHSAPSVYPASATTAADRRRARRQPRIAA